MTRVYELIRELGSIIENDLSPAHCSETQALLRQLERFACATGNAKSFRVAGAIVAATQSETSANTVYEALPEVARW